MPRRSKNLSSKKSSRKKRHRFVSLEKLMALLVATAIAFSVVMHVKIRGEEQNETIPEGILVVPKPVKKDASKLQSDTIATLQPADPTRDDNNVKYHVVFSTGCSPFQDWQSYVFFFHALQSGQRGNVTRIASCPNSKDAAAVQKLHREQISIMSDRFSLHITPDFSTKVKRGIKFKYFNKPFGMRDFMENVMGYRPGSIDKEHNKNDDTIVLLLDPDQMIIRPFTNDFEHSTEVWRPTNSKIPKRTKVEHGSPFAQQYGFGMQWKTKVNATYVANGTTRVEGMDLEEAKSHYAAGPPYIATARDMYSIVEKWTDFVVRIHDNYPHLLAEMFGYCFAAAHLNLPHRIAHSFMVSDVWSGGEGWKLVDNFENTQVCQPPPDSVPHVLHYCQRYMIGKWFIGKYRLRKDFISCDSPLLKEPPPDIVKLDYQEAPDGSRTSFKHKKGAARNAFMVCALVPRLNQAAEFFKKHHCAVEKANFDKTYIFHDNDEGM